MVIHIEHIAGDVGFDALCPVAVLDLLIVSSKDTDAGEMQPIITVRVLPPRESFNSRVSLHIICM
jgi:hypothetical protein